MTPPEAATPREWTDPLPAAVASFAVGIAAGLWGALSTAVFLALCGVATRRQGLAIVLLIGTLRGMLSIAARPPDVLAPLQGQRVTVRGVIVEPEVASERGCRFVIETRLVTSRRLSREVRARLQVEIGGTRRWPPPARWGQEVCLIGVIEAPRSDGRGFDYAGWLAARDIFEGMRLQSAADVTCCGDGDLGFAVALASRVRSSVERSIEALVPQPEAALLEGVLLAESRALPKDIADGFRDTGTYHVLVTAGIHLNFVAALCFAICGACGLGGHRAALVTIPVVGFFALVAGASPSILRAALMTSFSLVGHALGRPNGGVRGLCVAVAIMLTWNPRLMTEAGFQMSVACVLGIVTLTPLLVPRLRLVPLRLRGAVAVTLSTQLMVAPLGALYFGSVSLGGLAANLIVVPLCEGLLAVGSGIAMCGPLLPNLLVDPLAHALGLLGWGLGAAALQVTRVMRAMPLCSVQVSAPSLGEVAGWYTGLWGAMKLLRRRRVPDRVHNEGEAA